MSKKWNYQSLREEALKYNTKTEFMRTNNSAYVTACKMGIVDEICSHMEPIWERKWTPENLQREALKYKTRIEFERKNSKAYHSAKYHGLMDKICGHMNLNRKKWQKEELIEEARKYRTITDFMKNSGGAYLAVRRMDIREEAFKHMQQKVKNWTNEQLAKEALKYKNKSEFRSNNINAYSVAYRRKILDNICVHMKNKSGFSSLEKTLLAKIKEKYPKASSFRKNKIRIDEFPYIKTLEIDIYIPELRKGIEFDGKYWHSFEGLKRSHPTWSEEHLQNYHKIKDDYFRSTGIDIFHVKETDWLKNPEKCVNECFEFLEAKNVN